MKNKKFLTLALTLLIGSMSCYAQKKKPQTWEDKKANLPTVNEANQGKVNDALPTKATAKAKAPRRALVFYRCEGYVHKSIAIGNYALQQLGKQTGAFTADLADDYSDLNAENLANYDVIIFNNTTRLNVPEATKESAPRLHLWRKRHCRYPRRIR